MARPAVLPLQHVWDKINRGTDHLEELDAQVQPFLSREPYGFTPEFDEDRGVTVGRFKVREQEDRKWPVLAGEAASQFRSALDYLIYQLAILRRPLAAGTSFPIYTDEAVYCEKPRCRKCGAVYGRSPREAALRHIPKKYWALIDGLQPYHAGDLAKDDVLYVLNRFANHDKHRVTHSIVTKASDIRIVRSDDGVEIVPVEVPDVGRTFDDGAPVFAYPDIPYPHVPVKVNLTLTVAFGEGPVGMKELKGFATKVIEIADLFEHEVPEFDIRSRTHPAPPGGSLERPSG